MSKHPRLELVFEEWDVAGLPWWFVGNLRSNYGYRSNGSTDLPSNKNGDTAVASDTTDDLWFLSESDNERFNLAMKADTVDSDSSTDIDEDGKENGKKVLQDEGNEEDLEDTQSLSDDTDIDIVSEDCWQCTKCKKFNSPEKRYCFRCWALRKDWYSDCPKLLHSVSTPNITATKGKKEEEDEGIDIPECRRTVSDPVNRTADQNKLSEKNQTGPRSSIESLDLTQCNPPTASSPSCKKKSSKPSLGLPAALPESNKELLKPCCVCHRRPRNGNIIHGKTAHLVTCFFCARMLQKSKSPCPMCRQKINLVIKIFIA
ncbi:protein Mdm4 [Protopterus annectens]|uniref:protein Mdm4 n=1 Tax=Protopterus annectens TaxID=7888 RepID=UPI001CFB35D2|nr:protein Mdm4 [Protopterus annectens]